MLGWFLTYSRPPHLFDCTHHMTLKKWWWPLVYPSKSIQTTTKRFIIPEKYWSKLFGAFTPCFDIDLDNLLEYTQSIESIFFFASRTQLNTWMLPTKNFKNRTTLTYTHLHICIHFVLSFYLSTITHMQSDTNTYTQTIAIYIHTHTHTHNMLVYTWQKTWQCIVHSLEHSYPQEWQQQQESHFWLLILSIVDRTRRHCVCESFLCFFHTLTETTRWNFCVGMHHSLTNIYIYYSGRNRAKVATNFSAFPGMCFDLKFRT